MPLAKGDAAMARETPLPVSITVMSFAAPRRRARRVLGTVLGLWAAVALLLAAVILALAWDLRP